MARKNNEAIASQGLSLAFPKNLGSGHGCGGGVVASPTFFVKRKHVLSYKTIPIDIAICDTKEFCMTKEKKLYKNKFVDLKGFV
jgi:hypothetical protein